MFSWKSLSKLLASPVLAPKIASFAKDRRGSTATLFALAIIPVSLAVGVGVDFGRGLLVKERLNDAIDAAALAVGSWPDLSASQMQSKAQQFFNANYPDSRVGAVTSLTVTQNGSDIKIVASAKVPTTFMRLANVNNMEVKAQTVVTKKTRNIELVLVLDTTGSMASNGKITALKNAATQMVNTLFAGASTSDTLKVAVVPFSAAVNVGTTYKNATWIDKDSKSTIAKEDLNLGTKTIFDIYSQMSNRSWAGCVRERAAPYELTDTAPSTATPNTLFSPYLAPDEPDDGYGSGWYSYSYANNYLSDGDDGETQTCTTSYSWWGGSQTKCTTTQNSDQDTQAGIKKYTNGYVRSSSTGPDYNCTGSSITPLTSTKSTVLAAINALNPTGSTDIPAGLLWGWRVISPGEPFTQGTSYDDEKWVKAIVLLTDGENSVNGGTNGFNGSVYNAFGFAAKGHLGSTSGSNAEATLDTKTLQVCQSIKDKDILLYTVGFQVNSNSKSLLSQCATEPDMSYDSPTNSQLAGIFQDIAQGLGELRIAQ